MMKRSGRKRLKLTELIYIPLLAVVACLVYVIETPSSALFAAFFLVGGSFILIKGSDLFVESAVSISASLGVSEHTIGLTVVAFGTSLPELAVSVLASYQHHPETAWGNVVGSNVTNIALVLGIAMIITALKPSRFAVRDSLSMLVVSGIVLLLAYDGMLRWYDGVVLVVLYVVFIRMLRGRETKGESDGTVPLGPALVLLSLGIVGVAVGADAVVRGAVDTSRLLGVKEVAVAASIVALGTSLPELTASVMAAIKKHHGIAVGNVIGSNLMNIGFVLGIAAMVRGIPIPVASPAILFFIGSALMVPLVLKKGWIGRKTGMTFLALYALFVVVLYWLQ
ncbi:MAG: hypothetical protein DRN37_10945 [Thermoplasmata archaeon]|nr:MAG: hypothetical protein DRN37_10945 [Thermoplasmata archaeon]